MPTSHMSREDVAEIEAAVRRLPVLGVEEVLRAREASAAAPLPDPQLLPTVDFPYPLRHSLAGTVRFGCPLRCGWFYDEPPGLDPISPLVLPQGFTPQDLDKALTARTRASCDALERRLVDGFTEHYGREHPEHPMPARPGAEPAGARHHGDNG